MSTEFAFLRGGEIVTVLTTDGGRARAEEVARGLEGEDVTVVPLDSLPLDVKRRYRFWNERP